jgi:hypothetical protein
MLNTQAFLWHSYELDLHLRNSIGIDWAAQIIEFAKQHLKLTPIIPRSTTSREADCDSIIQAAVVDGIKIKTGLPWLYRLYREEFKDLACRATNQKLVCATNDLYGINLNVQIGNNMRYECHVDSNPVQGMLYITPHNEDSGGVLLVANSEKAATYEAVMQDCASIHPARGRLVFFDARKHSHFVTPLQSASDIRVAAAMNFYTTTCPESHRPPDLTKHLGLE